VLITLKNDRVGTALSQSFQGSETGLRGHDQLIIGDGWLPMVAQGINKGGPARLVTFVLFESGFPADQFAFERHFKGAKVVEHSDRH